mgnify:FL=1
MASSMIHLAITQCMTKEIEFKNSDRIRLGSILPDGAISGNSHLKKKICNDTRITYDLEFYREKYLEQMTTDDLYLGYYLHLVQDIFYRKYVYFEHNFDSSIPGNVEKLHRDYEITNWYVVNRYHLDKSMVRVQNLAGEPITELAKFDVPGLVEEVKQQFVPIDEQESFFFTKEMAEEFVDRATIFCLKEIKHISEGKPGLDSLEWSWGRK